jgi:hypothetical protein
MEAVIPRLLPPLGNARTSRDPQGPLGSTSFNTTQWEAVQKKVIVGVSLDLLRALVPSSSGICLESRHQYFWLLKITQVTLICSQS